MASARRPQSQVDERIRAAIDSTNGSPPNMDPNSQSALAVNLASMSPKPAATILRGAAQSTGRSAKTASGPWQLTVVLTPSMTIGAPMEVKPSTEAAVGSEMNSRPER